MGRKGKRMRWGREKKGGNSGREGRNKRGEWGLEKGQRKDECERRR